MKYLVLGGNGFIGSHLVKSLIKYGSVRVFDHNIDNIKKNFPQIEAVKGDFQNCDFEALLEGIDTVFHLIGTTTPFDGTEKIEEEILVNILPTIRLMDTMIKGNSNKLIFASSGGTVYGETKEALKETSYLSPICTYGLQKKIIEEYMLMYKKYNNLNVKIVRISNPYGTGQNIRRKQGAISVFVDLILNNIPLEIWGDGSAIRDYIHIDDVIDAMIAVDNYKGEHDIFNIGSGEGYSLAEIINEISFLLNKKPIINYKSKRLCDVEVNKLDVSHIYKECGWKAKISLKQGISMLLEKL